MKSFILIIILFVVALLGAFGIYAYQSQIPDIKGLENSVKSQLSNIVSLDTGTNELALLNRIHIENNYDAITASMGELSAMVEQLSTTLETTPSFTGSLLETRYESLQQEVLIKSGYIENFKTRFAVLRNSERYAPIVGKRIVGIADQNNLPEVAQLYRNTIIAILEFASQTSDNQDSLLPAYIESLQATEALMPEDAFTDILEFTRHSNTVLSVKSFVETYLLEAIQASTSQKIEDLELAWSQWTEQYDKPQQYLEIAVIGYVIYLLALLAITVFILRSFYKNLEQTIQSKTSELQHTFDQLHQSEGQLMQAEKLSSLGQMVAGIAHEINTPLGYLSSNVSTVKRDITNVIELYSAVELLDNQVLADKSNIKNISALLKKILRKFRSIKQDESVQDINELLDDSSQGIDEIAQLVTSLKDFSRQDKGDLSFVDIHEGLRATIKISGSVLKSREVKMSFNDTLPEIQFMPVQLNQVFLNIITNAAQATNEENGCIEIITSKINDCVSITFKDNGSGMDEQTQAKIFDPFFTTKQNNEGTGLGMSITYKVIQSHGGNIEIDSEIGKGSTITITLPITQDDYLESNS